MEGFEELVKDSRDVARMGIWAQEEGEILIERECLERERERSKGEDKWEEEMKKGREKRHT